MKHPFAIGRNASLPLITSFLLTATISLSAVYCLITGFDIEILHPLFIFISVFISALLVFLSCLKKARLWLLITTGVTLTLSAILWKRLFIGVQRIIFAVNACIAQEYPNADLGLSEIPGSRLDTTLLLFLGIFFIAFTTAWSTVRRTTWAASLLSVIIFVVPCLFFEFSQPSAAALVVLTVSFIVMLLTQYHRITGKSSFSAAAVRIILPVCAVILLLLLLFPPSDYSKPDFANRLKSSILESFTSSLSSDDPSMTGDEGSENGLNVESTIDLNSTGPRELSDRTLMRVFSLRSERIYLRAASYERYAFNKWLGTNFYEYNNADFPSQPLLCTTNEGSEAIMINFYAPSNVLYTPYYLTAIPEGGEVVADAYIARTTDESSYTAMYAYTPDTHPADSKYSQYVKDNYLSVNNEISDYVEKNFDPALYDADVKTKLNAVFSHLKENASYALDVPYCPEGEDFIMWFLTEQKQGYCIHFASAATCMLRAFGVPARYVSGVSKVVTQGVWNDMTIADMHAWVEYYDENLGWLPFEVTPSDDPLPDNETTETSPTDDNISTTSSSEPLSVETRTSPSGDQADSPAPAEDGDDDSYGTSMFMTVLRIILIITAIIGAIYLRRYLILRHRRTVMERLVSNELAIYLWGRCESLRKYIRECPVLPQAESIALKAKFSNHAISDDEIDVLTDYADSLTRPLRAQPRIKQIYYTMIVVLY